MPKPPGLVAGADVFKGRWICVVLENGCYNGAQVVDSLRQIPEVLGAIDLLALDIPIGLPADGTDWPRPADPAARAFIGPRRSSVFTAPPRPVYEAPSYASANALHRKLTTKGLSRQSWALRAKILEAEAFIADHPNTIEVHPEVCFRAMKGEPLEFSKKTWNGQMQRRALLATQSIDLPDQLDAPTGKTPPDDLLDAAAAAWSAWRCERGRGEALPESDSESTLSSRGLIWF
jgi:predicted RNase H-like nuclease